MGTHETQAPSEPVGSPGDRSTLEGRARSLLDRIAERADVALGVAIALLLLTPDSTYVLIPQLDVMRVAVLIPAIPLLLAARRGGLRLAPSDALLLAFIAAAVLSWAFGTSAENPRLLVATLLPFGFYLWGRIAGSHCVLNTLLWALVATSAVGSLTVLFEYVFAGRPLFVDEADYAWNAVDGLLFRPGGVYGSPPGAALIFSMTTFACVALIGRIGSAGLGRRLAVLCLLVLIAGVAVTFTRASYVGLLAGAAGYVLLTLPGSVVRVVGLTTAGIAALVAIASPLWLGSDLVQDALVRSSTFDYRLENWELAFDVIGESPGTAVGGEGFNALLLAREEYGAIQPAPDIALDSPLVTDGPHNQYLLTLIETGAIGLLAVVGWFATLIWSGVRAALAAPVVRERRTLAALAMAALAYAVTCLFGDHLRYDTGVAILALIAGILVSLSRGDRSEAGTLEAGQR